MGNDNNNNNNNKEMTLGQRLQKYRKAGHVSQDEMGEFCGLSRNHISAIERDLYKCNVYTLIDYGKKLNVSLDILTGLDNYEVLPELRRELQNTNPKEQKKLLEILKILNK